MTATEPRPAAAGQAPLSPPPRRAAAPFAIGALLIAALVLVIVLASGGSSYTVHAEFRDASQLIKGDLVEVGGLPVGTVSDLKLSNEGLADVVIKITDSRFSPVHQGATASIGIVGLSGVANRFVALNPGPTNTPPIGDGGSLALTQTQPLVDLDILLNSLTPSVRRDLQGIIQNGNEAFKGLGHAGNQAFHYLNPALSQLGALTAQLTSDKAALRTLITAGGQVADSIASRSSDLNNGISNTATAFRAIASERGALSDSLARAPSVLAQATGTTARLRAALVAVRPALREAQPVAKPLASFLKVFVPSSRDALPVAKHLLAMLPTLRTALGSVPPLANVAIPAVNATTPALKALLPIATGLRPYGPDIVQGTLDTVGGGVLDSYDANGHLARVAAAGSPGSGLAALFGPAGASAFALNSGVLRPCPGGAALPAPDQSNPFIPDPSACNPAHDEP